MTSMRRFSGRNAVNPDGMESLGFGLCPSLGMIQKQKEAGPQGPASCFSFFAMMTLYVMMLPTTITAPMTARTVTRS